MASAASNGVFSPNRLASLFQREEPMDGELLTAFIDHRDGDAFAALVGRHGPMVWGVCRRLLPAHEAEDAFQATFLVLVRKAATVTPRDLVGNWLYGVARQTALQARRTAARRRAREANVARTPDSAATDDLGRDLEPILDEEISLLPEHYQSVIVLCDLEGLTRKEAASRLGVPEGSIASRLARARSKLAKRLTKRGVAVSAAALTTCRHG
jgi:RNA polymerase sigma factor (sigma-70 family)